MNPSSSDLRFSSVMLIHDKIVVPQLSAASPTQAQYDLTKSMVQESGDKCQNILSWYGSATGDGSLSPAQEQLVTLGVNQYNADLTALASYATSNSLTP